MQDVATVGQWVANSVRHNGRNIGEQIILNDVKLTLSGESSDPTWGTIIAMINSSNNLPTSQFYNQSDITMLVEALQTTLTTVIAEN
jgi:hypothetical protein